jgi:hypothetical protein
MAKKNTIVTRITLEGAQQITGDLKNLGAAGEKALGQIRKATEAANSGGAKLQAVITSAQQVLTRFGNSAGNLVKSVDKVGDSIGRVATRVAILTAAVTGAAGAFVAFNANAGASAEEIQNQASAVGLTTGELQKFSFAAKTVGLDSEKFTQVMSILVQELENTAKATDSSETALGRFGITADQAAGLLQNPAEALKLVADQVAAMPDGFDKTGAVIDIFGRRIGAKLIPFLNQGAAGLNKLGQEAVRLGAAVSDETLTRLATFDDALDVLKATAKGTQLSIAAIFAPALTRGTNALTELLADNQGRLEAFANTIVNLVVPVVRDFINAVTGHDQDVQAQWVLDLRDNVVELAQAVQSAFTDIIIPAFNAIVEIADKVAQAINGIFGTDFTGKELLVAAAVLQIVGAFGLLSAAIGVVVAAFGLFGSTAGTVIAAVVLIGLDIVLLARKIASIDWAGIWDSIKQAALNALKATGEVISQGFKAAADYVKGVLDDLANYIENSWLGRIVAAVIAAIARIRSARAAADNASAAGAAAGARIGGHARGGPAGRPGRRGRRDRVLAWFDPEEFVVRAEAVRQVGANALNFINRTGDLPGFAMGGLVAAAAGASPVALAPLSRNPPASGGPRHTLNLTLEGETFPGMLIDNATLAALTRFAAGKRLTSGGRKPSWYAGGA